MVDRPHISVLITDLDNTLFDWFAYWYGSFSALVDGVVRITGIPRGTLLREAKDVHQRHGTSEYAFLLEELPSIRKYVGDREVFKVLAPAISMFRKKQKDCLKLYPCVSSTLWHLKVRGVNIIGYTESMEPYTVFRLNKLGLDGILDAIYTPRGHQLPIYDRQQGNPHWIAQSHLARTLRHFTPEHHFKPDPSVLAAIVHELRVDAKSVAYVGDSLMKDVAMAQKAGVHDVHAAYGVAHKREEYELLREVTHWTAEDVERERRLSQAHVQPTFVLEEGFADILRHFDFGGNNA